MRGQARQEKIVQSESSPRARACGLPRIVQFEGRRTPVLHLHVATPRHLSNNPTSMICLCQEGKSSPDALGEERGYKSFLILRRVCWPLGRGSYFL